MATVYIDNWVTIEFVIDQDGSVTETIFNYKSDTNAISPGDAQVLVDTWADTMVPLLMACLSQDVALLKVHLKTRFKTFPNVEAIFFPPSLTVGGINSPVMPGNVAEVVTLLTGVIGRKNRGRQYLMGATESNCSGNSFSSALALLMAAAWARNLTGFAGAGITILPCVASRVGEYLRVQLGFNIDTLLDSMRRRLSGRGR